LCQRCVTPERFGHAFRSTRRAQLPDQHIATASGAKPGMVLRSRWLYDQLAQKPSADEDVQKPPDPLDVGLAAGQVLSVVVGRPASIASLARRWLFRP
jgi:hypothetical protein